MYTLMYLSLCAFDLLMWRLIRHRQQYHQASLAVEMFILLLWRHHSSLQCLHCNFVNLVSSTITFCVLWTFRRLKALARFSLRAIDLYRHFYLQGNCSDSNKLRRMDTSTLSDFIEMVKTSYCHLQPSAFVYMGLSKPLY